MKKLNLLVLFVLLLSTLSSMVYAEIITGSTCQTDSHCIIYPNSYCDTTLGVCITGPKPIETNTTTTTPTTTTPTTTAPSGTVISQIIDAVKTLDKRTLNTDEKVKTLEESISANSNKITSLSAQVQTISSSQEKVKEKVEKDISTVSTGLATLQKTVEDTDSKIGEVKSTISKSSRSAKLASYTLIILVAIGAAILIFHYLTQGKSSNPDDEIVNYISIHIKQGKKYPEIRQKLLGAGWSDKEIKDAYDYTTEQNYKIFQQSSTGNITEEKKERKKHPLHGDVTKIGVILFVSIIIIIGAIFLIKGTTTGHAIHFKTQDDLSSNIHKTLVQKIANNELYPLIESTDACIQVIDKNYSTSFRFIKTPNGHSIVKLEQQCDTISQNFDFAVKFLNANSFERLINKLDCGMLRGINYGKKDLVVLPSKNILEGFKPNPNLDLEQFCPVLTKCLRLYEIRDDIGFTCPTN